MTVWRSFWINIHMAIDLHTSSWVHYKFHLSQVGRSPDVSSDNFDWRQVHLSTKRNICVAPFKLRVTKMDTFAQSQLNCAPCTPAQAWSFRGHLRPSRSEAIGSDSVFINGMGRINERHCDIKAWREKPLADSDRLPVFWDHQREKRLRLLRGCQGRLFFCGTLSSMLWMSRM